MKNKKIKEWKFNLSWEYYGQVFIGVGFILGKEYIGLTLSNLFIGFKYE